MKKRHRKRVNEKRMARKREQRRGSFRRRGGRASLGLGAELKDAPLFHWSAEKAKEKHKDIKVAWEE